MTQSGSTAVGAAQQLNHRSYIPLVAGAAVFGLAASHGGYWSSSWTWVALGALCVLARILLHARIHRVAACEIGFLCAGLGLAAWTWFSTLWSASSGAAFEAERLTMYALVTGVVLLAVRRTDATQIFGAVLGAVVLVSGYALLERLFPNRLGVYDPVAGYRLSGPIGYWNGLGIFTVLGVLVALGFACRAKRLLVRGAAAASVVVLVATLYFTFSRGAWISLGVGLLVAFGLDRRRLQLFAYLVVLAPSAVAAVLFASHSDALTHRFRPAPAAAHDGHQLAVVIAVLAVAAAAATVGASVIERTVNIPRALQQACALIIAVAALAGLGAVFVRDGGPSTIARRAYNSFKSPSVAVKSDLNRRLFSLSNNGRVDAWRAAWRDYAAHRLAGSGAASYESWWNKHRPTPVHIRNAHSLYLETLAELGPTGLVLIIGIVALPFVAAFRARRHPLVPAVAGAFASFVLHAGVDWDWQLAGVTVAALLCGAGLLVSARKDDCVWSPTPRVKSGLACAILALIGVTTYLVAGNTALSRAQMAAERAEFRTSEAQAARATRWMGWSAEPWRLLGEAQLALSQRGAAASLRKSIARDASNWLTWFDLAAATDGPERSYALARARALNPLNPEIKRLENG